MPLTYFGESSVAYPAVFGGASTPANYYFGLQTTSIWAASTAYTTEQYIIPTAFNTYSQQGTGTNRIFVATTNGNSGGTQPDFVNVAPGGTVVDGGVTWQDVASTTSPFWLSTTPTFSEVVGNGYTRVEYANNTTNFPAPSGSSPTSGTNSLIISFPTSTGSWGTIAAVSIHDTLTSGDCIAFMYLSTYLTVSSSGITPSIPASTGLTLSLT